jgi:hypothetical protein
MKLLARPQLVILVTLVAVAALLPFAGCDKATPVAPSGTTLAISASPSTVSLTGTSTVTVIGRRPNGSPLIPGTEVQFSTNLGSITPTLTTTNSAGEATATFRADGRAGAATITASTNSSSGPSDPPTTGTSIALEEATAGVSVTTTIQVGESAGTKPTLLVSATPNSLAINETSTILVIARNADGSPVAAGRTVILTTSLGTVSPNRPVTQSDGTARATLNAGTQAGTAKITAVLGSSDAVSADVTIRDQAASLGLSASPASIGRADSTVTITAFVANAQQQPLSGAAVQFKSTLGSITAVAFTGSNGAAEATLTVKQAEIGNNTKITVTAKTPGVEEKTIDIEIR